VIGIRPSGDFCDGRLILDAPQLTPSGHVPSLSQPPLRVPSVQKPPCFVGETHSVLPSGSETFLVSPGMAPGSMPAGAPSPRDSKSWTTLDGAFSALQKSSTGIRIPTAGATRRSAKTIPATASPVLSLPRRCLSRGAGIGLAATRRANA